MAISDLHDQATLGAVDEEFKSCEIAPYNINGAYNYEFQCKFSILNIIVPTVMPNSTVRNDNNLLSALTHHPYSYSIYLISTSSTKCPFPSCSSEQNCGSQTDQHLSPSLSDDGEYNKPYTLIPKGKELMY